MRPLEPRHGDPATRRAQLARSGQPGAAPRAGAGAAGNHYTGGNRRPRPAAGFDHRRLRHGRHHPARDAARFQQDRHGVVAGARDHRPGHLRHCRRGRHGFAARGSRRRKRDAVSILLLRRARPNRLRPRRPSLVWALLFVTAVGLGPFPGALALSVHSIGMLGRLFAETIEHMDMAPIDALTLTGARRVQVFTHGIVPSILPSLLGIALYRLDENIRPSLVLGFVGAGGIGFELLSAMSLFQYQLVSLLLIVTFVIVIAAERLSALLRARLG